MLLLFFLLLVFSPQPASAQSVSATWIDTSNNEDGFRMERQANGGSFFETAVLPANAQQWTDSQVLFNLHYCYRIRAHNMCCPSTPCTPIDCFSGYSNTACVTLTAQTPNVQLNLTCLEIQEVAPSGLVAAYGFNQNSGTITVDSSGNGNTGTLSGATWTTSGKYGSALNFSRNALVGINGPSLEDIATFSYCAWVYPRSQGGQADGRILHKGTNSSRKQFHTDSGVGNSLALYVDRSGGAAQAVSVANTLTLNQWQYVCATYDETKGARLYKNSVELSYSTNTVGAGTTADDSGAGLSIGNRSTADKGWDGLIDEVRIYNRVLTSAEQLNIMNIPVL